MATKKQTDQQVKKEEQVSPAFQNLGYSPTIDKNNCLFSGKEACSILKVKPKRLRELRRLLNRQLPYFKIMNRIYYRAKDIYKLKGVQP